MGESRVVKYQLVRPLLTAWREPGVLHLGFDGSDFTLSGVPDEIQRAIELLAQPRTRGELAARLPGLDRRWIGWLCEHLSTAGLLTRVDPAPSRPLLVFGGGELAGAVASSLRIVGLRPRQLAGVPDLLPRSALVVIAARTAEPDRTLLNRLVEAGTEHLVVRVEPSRAVVGPFVDPVSGPCVRCDDLARARLDRGWPVLLAQLCATTVQPDAGLVDWAAAIATAQLRGRLTGQRAELSGRCLELGTGDFRLRSRDWPVHPGCGYHKGVWAGSGTLAG